MMAATGHQDKSPYIILIMTDQQRGDALDRINGTTNGITIKRLDTPIKLN